MALICQVCCKHLVKTNFYLDALVVAAGALHAQFAASFRSPLPLYSAA